MGSALVVAAVKFGLLAVLWLFVIFAFRTLRSDLSGSRAGRAPAPPRVTSAAAPRTPSAASNRPSGRSSARRLVVTEGALTGTTIGLGDEPVTLGRADDSTLVLTDDYASSRHARLILGDGTWLVEELGSTNGTYLGPDKVVRPTPVPIGRPIRIGKTVLELRR
jgi:pSer/pThr/pTyr-binding forkhead associated (FHA) protein